MPLLSIIIPTHNRACYAIPTVRSVLSISQDIEVVVCDTSDTDELSTEFGSVDQFKNLKLVRPRRPLSVVDNFNEALAAATGDYLVFIGDDDFVTHKIVEVANHASQNKIDSVKFTFPVLYFWPDYLDRKSGNDFGGTLQILPYTGLTTPHDAQKALADASRNFGGGVLDMPRAYAGMISKSLAKDILNKYGFLFGGVSPDIYSAALISNESKRCVKVDYPVIIPGASGASTSGQSANGKHVGGLRDNAHIGAFPNLIWDERIPEFYSVPTVWAYSLLKALEVINATGNARYPRLYLKCLLYQDAFYRNHVTTSLRRYYHNSSLLRFTLDSISAILGETSYLAKRAFVKLGQLYRSNRAVTIKEIMNTEAARQRLDDYLKSLQA